MTKRQRALAIGLVAFGVLCAALGFKSVVSRFCAVCGSELTVRQHGLALSESFRLWSSNPVEELSDSGVAQAFLPADHVHDWQTWSNRYHAMNGRSAVHPTFRLNPAAKAWQLNPGFQASVRRFADLSQDNLLVVRAMFLLPKDPDELARKDPGAARTIEQCQKLFEDSGEALPPAWARLRTR